MFNFLTGFICILFSLRLFAEVLGIYSNNGITITDKVILTVAAVTFLVGGGFLMRRQSDGAEIENYYPSKARY